MLLNIALYVFAAIGVFAFAFWVWEAIRDRDATDSPPRGIPRPAPTDAYRNFHTHVQLTAHTPMLLSHLYTLEYGDLPEGHRNDPKAKLPDDIRQCQGPLSAKACCLMLEAINHIRAKRAAEPIKLAPDMDAVLRKEIELERKHGYEHMARRLIPSVRTLSLLERLHKIEYDELAVGTHDAYRHDPLAQIPTAVHDELDYTDARASVMVIRTINYIRSKSNIEPLEVMPDFDDMLRRIIQRYEDEFNYPPTNFLR